MRHERRLRFLAWAGYVLGTGTLVVIALAQRHPGSGGDGTSVLVFLGVGASWNFIGITLAFRAGTSGSKDATRPPERDRGAPG